MINDKWEQPCSLMYVQFGFKFLVGHTVGWQSKKDGNIGECNRKMTHTDMNACINHIYILQWPLENLAYQDSLTIRIHVKVIKKRNQ